MLKALVHILRGANSILIFVDPNRQYKSWFMVAEQQAGRNLQDIFSLMALLYDSDYFRYDKFGICKF